MQQLYIYPEHRSDGGLLPAVCVGVWTEKLKKKNKTKSKTNEYRWGEYLLMM